MAQPLPYYESNEPTPYEGAGSPLKYYWGWASRAICGEAGLDPETFFISKKDTVLRAKFLCKLCPVKKECLTHALIHDEEGFWGGLSEDERESKYPKKYRSTLRIQHQGEILNYEEFRRVFLGLPEGQSPEVGHGS